MRRIFSRTDLQALSSILAVVLFLASVPIGAGVIVVTGPSHPEFTVDICHPLQVFDRAPGTPLARPAAAVPETVLCDLGSITADAAPRSIELRIAPDTPPTKLPA